MRWACTGLLLVPHPNPPSTPSLPTLPPQNCTKVPAKTYPWNVTEVWPTASECHFRTTPYDCWDTWTGGMAASTSHTDAMAVHRLLLAGDAVEAMVGSVALTGTKVPS